MFSRILFVLAGVLLFVGSRGVPTADLVLKNGTVVTLDDEYGTVEVLAAAGDTILAVGSSSDIEAYIGETTRVVDLNGQLAVPGFIEGRGHFMGMGRAQMHLDLLGTPSWETVVSMVDSAVAANAPPTTFPALPIWG